MNGHSRQSPVATATPPQATLSQPPEGIGAGGYEEGGGNRGAGGDTPQPQQVPLQQHSQRYQTHREGDSSVPRATFHLPPSTTLMRSDTIPPAQEMYGPTAGGGGGGIPHATAYQQTAPNIYPQGQATAIYQNIQQAQYYYNPANGHAYYGTTAPGAYMTAGMPQALLMSPQQHQQAYHQQQQMLAAQHMAAAQQSHPQGAMAVPAHHAAAVLMPTATSVAQIPPVSVVSGAGAAVVVAAQQSSTMAAMSATHGAVPPGTTHLPANVVVTSSATGQSIPPQQQLQREKKVLKFVHPDTQKELDLSSGAANEPKRKANSAVDGKEKSAAEETDKTISVKEFQKRVTERMKYGAGGDLKAAEGNGRTPAVTPPPSAQITREGLERLDQTEQVDTVSDWIQTIPNQRLVYGGQASDMHISLDQQQQKDGQQYVSGPVANFVVQQQQQSVVHHQTQLSSTSPPTIAVEQQVIHPFPQSQQQPVPTVQQQQQRLSPGPRIQRLLDMNVVKPTMEQPVEVPEQQTVPKIVSTVVVLQVEEPPVVISPPMVISPPVVISPPAAEDEEEEAVPGDTETIGGGSRKGSQNDLNGEEESAADRLTPTQDGGEEMTEERIRELEEQMQLLEKSDENNDPEQFVYSRKFLYFIRKVTLALKTVNCPKTEDELEELGLSRRGMPTVQSFSVGGKAKRFDGASSDQFKTAWQQPGGGGGGGGGLNQFGTGSGGRFTTSRPPYSGRHSDNKLKPKKGPIARQSLDQRPLKLAQISSSQAAELSKRSTNAWKPKREERFDMSAPTRDEDEIKYEKLCKEVRGLLNKVTPSTYKDLSEDFIQYKIHDDPKLLEMIIDLIFDKAVEEPHFCPLYSDLCERQVEEEKRAMAERQDKQPQEKSFRSEIIQKCQKTFLASNQFDEKISDLKKKLDELDEADEKARTQVEEEIEIRRSKEKRRLLGIIRFISQLYRHHLLIDLIINWCAVELIKRYEITKDEVYIEYAVELLATVGKVYEKRQDTPRGSASVAQDHQKDSFSLEKIFGHLTTLKKDMSNRIRFAIQELEDLRQNKWMPRGGEKGPKTIEEVREEVEKEHQENEMERIEHDKQKEREKMQQTSRKNTRPSYGGRSSADRRSAAAANATSLLTGRADSRISTMSKLSEVDSFSGLGGGRKRWDHPRDRTPQKEDSGLGPASAGGASGAGGGGGGGTFSSETAWRSTSRGGTDSPKDSSGGHGAHGGGGGD